METTQSQEEINYKHFLCKQHLEEIHYIYLKDQFDSKLGCRKCLTEKRFDYDYIIEIEYFISQKPTKQLAFMNLPNGLKGELYNQLKSAKFYYNNRDQIVNQIEKLFTDFTTIFLQTIDNHKKSIIAQIDKIEDERNQVINKYNEIISKKEIIDNIKQYQNQPELLDQYLQEYYNKKQPYFEQDIINIQNQLNLHTSQDIKYDFNLIHQQLYSFLDNFKSISMIKSNGLDDILVHELNNEENQENRIEEQQEEEVKQDDNKIEQLNNPEQIQDQNQENPQVQPVVEPQQNVDQIQPAEQPQVQQPEQLQQPEQEQQQQ